MKVRIMGRAEMIEQARVGFSPRTAVISITDTDKTAVEFTHQPAKLLQLKFDDVSEEIYEEILGRKPSVREMKKLSEKFHMVSDEQAKSIAEFILPVYEEMDTLICQCEYGQSRSAGVAAAVLEYFTRSGITIFAAHNYYPNKLVFKKVLHQLNRYGCRKKEPRNRTP